MSARPQPQPSDGQLDSHIAAMLQALERREGPDLVDLPLKLMREVFASAKLGKEPPLPELDQVRDLQVEGAVGPLNARLYIPHGAATPGPLLVYFHGGGFVIGSVETADSLCRRISAEAKLRVLSVDYRLAPEHPFPAAHEDAEAAVLWIVKRAGEFGFDPRRIAVGGDSAGANLAASTALALRGRLESPIAFQLLLYPVTQYTDETPSERQFGEGYFLSHKEMDFFRDCLFGAAQPAADPRLSVLHAGLAGAPPALIVTAGFDPLKDHGTLYAEALRRADVKAELRDYPGMIHGFLGLAAVSPAVLDATAEIARALGEALDGGSQSGFGALRN